MSLAERHAVEIWKPIPGFNGYEASDLGRVRSIDRVITVDHRGRGEQCLRRYCGRILRASPGPRGYLRVRLGYSCNVKYVAKLIMLAFVGDPPPGYQVAHNDGNNTNNRLLNLRYDTPLGNTADKLIHGTHSRGERCPTSRLTRKQIYEIRKSPLDRKTLAILYKVSKSHINNIMSRHRWSWLQ